MRDLLGIMEKMMGKTRRNSKTDKKEKKQKQIKVRRGGNNMTNVKKTGVFGLNAKVQTGGGCGGGCGPVSPSNPILIPNNPTTPLTGTHNTINNGVNVAGGRVTSPVAGRTTYTAPQPQFWETDIETATVKSCGVFGDSIAITVDALARNKMNMLMAKFEKTEWLAYLIGDKDTYHVTDIIIPKQRVTAVRVDVDAPVNVPIIGVIHSHHDMGNGFSGTDDDYINQNHDISLCITHSKITGQVRVKTECGRFFLADAKVITGDMGFDTAEFDKEITENIKKSVYTNYYQGGNPAWQGNRVGVNNINRPPVTTAHAGSVTTDVSGFPHTGEFGGMENIVEIEDDYSDLDMASNEWDTGIGQAPSAVTAKAPKEVLIEVEAYKESIKELHEPDAFYTVEFNMLIGFIRSIGTGSFDTWEETAFAQADNVYTSDYYRLIDEISLYNDQLNNQEAMALKGLADELEKMIEVSQVN